MKFPLFFWTRRVVPAYAALHVRSDDFSRVVTRAFARIQNYPWRYYFLSQLCFFVTEFIVPICFGYLTLFSRLPKEKAMLLVQRLQNTQLRWGKLILLLLKAPVMLS